MAALNNNSGSETRPPQRAWPGLLFLAIFFIAATVWTWRRWPNVFVDFGVQLYLPWRIADGAVYNLDFKYLTGGPLSLHWDALLFKIFGASFLTLSIANLLLAAAFLTLLNRAFFAVSDRLTATAITLAVMVISVFGQFESISNYNFIAPYSHEIVHGLMLSALAVMLLARWLEQPKFTTATTIGFCWGLVFMTKPDVFLALTFSILTTFALRYFKTRTFALKSLVTLLVTALIPPFGFLIYFHQYQDWFISARSVAFAFVPLFESSMVKEASTYYKWCSGLDFPLWHLGRMFLQFFVLAAIITALGFLFRLNTQSPRNRMIMVFAVAVLLAGCSAFSWYDCGRSLPLITLALIFVSGFELKKHPASRMIFPFLWSVFSLFMLARLGIFGRIWHYGFVLAMPALAGAIYFLLWLLPSLLEKYSVNSKLLRWTLLLALMFGLIRLAALTNYFYHGKNTLIGHGANTINVPDSPYTSSSPLFGTAPESMPLNLGLAADWLEQNTPTTATVTVLPEGALINFLAHRVNPCRYNLWVPPDIAAFGQTKMVADFESRPPDYVVLAHRSAIEFHAKYFGLEESYGRGMLDWIHANYDVVYQIGEVPLRRPVSGLQILKRRLH